MKILLSGGGTGGHITPILAVCRELKQLQHDCTTIYVGERNGKFRSLTADNPAIDEQYSVFSGKLRRYHGESWIRRILDVKTNLKNIRDLFYVGIGFCQSFRLLGKVRPDVVFLKGGYVGVPVGLAAALRRIPIVTHDSDSVPGLANRLVSRWTGLHTVAMPPQTYAYPQAKTEQVGVLVEHNYQPVDVVSQSNFKRELGFNSEQPVLLITGGSSGAERINEAAVAIMPELLQKVPALQVVHQVGQGKGEVYGGFASDRLKVVEFMRPMHIYTAAADLIVTRAGANALAEFGVQGKACVVIPSAHLSGGHQTKNADYLKEQGTAKVLAESKLYDSQHGLLSTILELLNDEGERKQLGTRLQQATVSGAAHKLAQLLIEKAKTKTL